MEKDLEYEISLLYFFMRRRYGRKRKVGRTRRFRKGSTTKRFARIAKSVFNRSVETKEARYTYSSVGGINFSSVSYGSAAVVAGLLVQLLKVLAKHSVLAILFMLGEYEFTFPFRLVTTLTTFALFVFLLSKVLQSSPPTPRYLFRVFYPMVPLVLLSGHIQWIPTGGEFILIEHFS